MKLRYILPILAVSVGVAGCATTPVPVASNFPASSQQIARTAQHWNIVANSVVEQTLLAINSNPLLQKRSIYLQRPNGANAFNISFHDFLINHMVGSGASVNVCKPTQSTGTGFEMDGKPVDVTYEARVIQHNGIGGYRPGEWLAIGTGVAALYNASSSWSHSEIWGTGIGLGVLAELEKSAWPSSTNTELVVTTTIAENNRYIFRRSDIYYIADADAGLYFKRVKLNSNCPEDQILANESSSQTSKEDARVRMFMKDNARHENKNKDYYWK
jgi:hypothetical protein